MITSPASPSVCNCTITQGDNTYPISALIGNESAASFYSYNNPAVSSANTGLELADGLIIFLYEDATTGIISLFLIADIANSGSGGEMSFEINCLPPGAVVVVQDDAGEFVGAPPLITGNWSWQGCCTDGGAIQGVGCMGTLNLDLLVSNGLDSIVWLTGDINNPDQILLEMTGEAITIDCGGGICCPVGLDTEVLVTDATCPDTPDGSISLTPQDGVPMYSYTWLGGETTSQISGLLPGSYFVTVTDSQGCTEEIQITVGVSPGPPPANPAQISLCAETTTGIFDLTSVESVVNGNAGNTVHWFLDSLMGSPIGSPATFSSTSTTIYAFVDNGDCLSAPVAVTLEVLVMPVANTTTLALCEETLGMATFDLTSLEAAVSGGAGAVAWYSDGGLLNAISVPSAFVSGTTTVFAVVNDGFCDSAPVMVQLTVNLKPLGSMTEITMCGNAFGEATFDLTSVDLAVSGGSGTVEWYWDDEFTLPVADPTALFTTSITVFAAVFDGTCYSDPVPVLLTVDVASEPIPLIIEVCDEGGGEALFNLGDYEIQVSGGQGTVEWYLDMDLDMPVPDPGAFSSGTDTIYATVDNGLCVSLPAPIQLIIIPMPTGTPTMLETCADSTGEATFDLTGVENVVSGGNGMVHWFQDLQGENAVPDPTEFLTSGTTVYAQIADGDCLSGLIPVDLVIVNTVTATEVTISACSEQDSAIFDLSASASLVSGGSGTVQWFSDSLGTQAIVQPGAFSSADGVVYAMVIAGVCASEIVPVQLEVLPAPDILNGLAVDACGDAAGLVTIDLSSFENGLFTGPGFVLWFSDEQLMDTLTGTTVTTGSATFYAVVSNGACVSEAAQVVIGVMSAPVAITQVLEYCVAPGSETVDLTVHDQAIGGGLDALWYADSTGQQVISTPENYTLTPGTDTLWVVVFGGCPSEITPVILDVLDAPEAVDQNLQLCADSTGFSALDLTAYDLLVGGPSDTITWFADPVLFNQISRPDSFVTADTVIYATVTNGFCTPDTAKVTIQVVDDLQANPVGIVICVIDTSVASVDLTAYASDISGGSGQVLWFRDQTGMDTIQDPQALPTSGEVVFAQVVSDGCVSDIVPVEVTVRSIWTPEPTCAIAAIDSILINWPDSADGYFVDYSVNGQIVAEGIPATDGSFGVGGLQQGDTVEVSITAIFAGCFTQLTTGILCITDVCPVQNLTLDGLEPELCDDVAYLLIKPSPSGGQLSGEGISGDTLFPGQVSGGATVIRYTWEDPATGCVYEISEVVSVDTPLLPPQLTCNSASISSVEFAWEGSAPFQYVYTINNGPLSGNIETTDTGTMVDGLAEGDSVTFLIWSAGPLPCGNSDTVMVACVAKTCPPATIDFIDPGVVCSDAAPLQLQADITGLPGEMTINWSGPGIFDLTGMFDPALVAAGDHLVTLQVQADGCVYDTSFSVRVRATPVALFEVPEVHCLDQPMPMTFTGMASDSAMLHWELGGAVVSGGNWPRAFTLEWPGPGEHEVSLWLEDNGCVSDTLRTMVIIESPLESPQVVCVDEDFHQIVVAWDAVPGAETYLVSSTAGLTSISGTSAVISQLPDNTTIEITVTAVGPESCGAVATSLSCETREIIPPRVYVPNVFSPNGDGVNDMFFVQANDEVGEVVSLRVYDRWGELMFARKSIPVNIPETGWDGTFAGEAVPPGVYVYRVEVQTVTGETIVLTGDVTVMK
ncbi:MAG: gliding motility-associated C-terminal domain-containing protein [Saprospiraceae bacterium]|nr:gliding motility-associated C-terminal domain-containing protein [Saprospiraceae bacterium]